MYVTNMCPPCSSRIITYTREVSVVPPGPQTQHPPWREPFSLQFVLSVSLYSFSAHVGILKHRIVWLGLFLNL